MQKRWELWGEAIMPLTCAVDGLLRERVVGQYERQWRSDVLSGLSSWITPGTVISLVRLRR